MSSKPRRVRAELPLEVRLHDEERWLRQAANRLDGRSSLAKRYLRIADVLAHAQMMIAGIKAFRQPARRQPICSGCAHLSHAAECPVRTCYCHVRLGSVGKGRR